MRKFNIKVPSEKKMRAVMGKWLDGKHIICEKVQMMFNDDERKREKDKNGKKFQVIKGKLSYTFPFLKKISILYQYQNKESID